MKSILISNLGNRHIKKDGHLVNPSNFRNDTEDLWKLLQADYDATQERIDINMLLHVLDRDELRGSVAVIYLIYTEQPADSRHSASDTVYEAKILKHILEREYGETVELIRFDGNPARIQDAFEKLAAIYRGICRQHLDKNVVYIDAGGTPALKTAGKELLRYYVPQDRLQLLHVAEDGTVSKVESEILTRYNLMTVARRFVESFQYKEAVQVLHEVPDRKLDRWELYRILEAFAWRKNLDTVRAVQRVNALAENPSEHAPLLRQLAGVFNEQANYTLSKYLGTEQNSTIYELATVCQLYFHAKDYTFGVVMYYRLCEELCNSVLEAQKDLPYKEHYDLGLSDKLNKCLSTAPNELLPIFKHIKPTLAGLKNLRNQSFLAHNSQPVSKKAIEKIDAGFFTTWLPALWQHLKLPEKNLYLRLNTLAEELFLAE